MVSCNQVESTSPSEPFNSARTMKIEYVMTQQSWSIAKFWNEGEDISRALSNAVVEFKLDGTVTISNGIVGQMGRWYTL